MPTKRRFHQGNLFWGLHEHFKVTNRKNTAIDVGALRGAYTPMYCSIFDHVVAFEPNLEVTEKLKDAVQLFDNVTLHNIGLWNRNTEIDFYPVKSSNDTPRGISSVKKELLELRQEKYPTEKFTFEKTNIKVKTLDSFEYENVDFIKIDVEGSEVEVIKGAIDTIKKYKPTIQVEVSIDCDGISSIEEIKKILSELGYNSEVGYNEDKGMNDVVFIHSSYSKRFFVNELVDPLTTPERVMIAKHPNTHPDIFVTMAKYDLSNDVLRALKENETIKTEYPDILDIVIDRLQTEEDKIKKFKNMCPLPWNHFSTFSNGNIRLCCEMIGSKSKHGTLFTKSNTPLNSNRNTLQDIRNNSFTKEVRRKMMNNEVVPECNQCYHRESLGMTSKRKQFHREYINEFQNYMEHTEEDGTIDISKVPMRNLDLRFGNQCNQKCRTCGPGDSSLWVEDYVKLSREKTNKTEKDALTLDYYGTGQKYNIKVKNNGQYVIDSKDFDWYSDSKLWTDMLDSMKDITTLYFTGGEPTINKRHRELLKYCIDKGYAKNINIDYNTNLQATPTYLYKWWKEFRRVGIGASIDGFGTVQEYMRHPAKWENTAKNIEAIGNLKIDNIKVEISPTISIMNIFSYTDLADYILESNYRNIKPVLQNHTLYYPDFYCIQTLPAEVKHKVVEHYEQWFKKIENKYTRAISEEYRNRLTPVLTFMNEADNSNKLSEFFWYNKTMDKIRNESWEEMVPDMASLLEKYNDYKQSNS